MEDASTSIHKQLLMSHVINWLFLQLFRLWKQDPSTLIFSGRTSSTLAVYTASTEPKRRKAKRFWFVHLSPNLLQACCWFSDFSFSYLQTPGLRPNTSYISMQQGLRSNKQSFVSIHRLANKIKYSQVDFVKCMNWWTFSQGKPGEFSTWASSWFICWITQVISRIKYNCPMSIEEKTKTQTEESP